MSLGADDVWSSRYACCVRYPQGGGLTPERQAFRERIRLEASKRFAAGASNAEVAKDLRVSVRSVQRWRRAWHDAGTEGLRAAGPVSRPKLSPYSCECTTKYGDMCTTQATSVSRSMAWSRFLSR
ncbi:helix-turn-helix domain-containing protein [Streptomyces sp. NPDC006285]|uniref:helix-turn-helix domain-containing protein n=1 Tax=Streptomyces sp. NPDC006285 TaxID=3364742 RepID=UPI0036B53638